METTTNIAYQLCIKRGKIRPFSRGKMLVKKELTTARNDLKAGKETFSSGNYKWTTIQCYYSMFHSARAILYKKNLREKSHRCLLTALRVLYVNDGALEFQHLEALEKARMLREDADYYDRWSKDAAEMLLDAAKNFLQKAKFICEH